MTTRNHAGPPVSVPVRVAVTWSSVHRVIDRPGTVCQFEPEIVTLSVVHFARW